MNVKNLLPTLLAALVLAAASCTSDKTEESSTASSYKLDHPLTEAHLQLDAEPDRLNPLLTNSNYSNTVLGAIMPRLIDIDPASMEMKPQLALSRAEVEMLAEGPYAGGVAYTFEIRPEAVWDNGEPVTAEDFIFALKLAFNPKIPATIFRVYLAIIKEVEVDADNPRRFTVYTDEQSIIGEEIIGNAIPPLPAYHYDPDGLMADVDLADLLDQEKAKKLAEEDERFQQMADLFSSPKYNREPEGIIGCGAYRLASWETGQRLILERKENWWGDQVKADMLQAYPERMVFQPIADPNTGAAALKDGQLDVYPNMPPKQFQELKESAFVQKDFNFFTPTSLVHTFFYCNTRSPKLQDKTVRQAIAHAINVEEMIETAFNGLAVPSTGPVHPTFNYYNKDIQPIAYEPETARSLLEEAGWTDSNNNGIVDKIIDGQLTELSLQYNYTAGRDLSQNIALLLKESAKRAGIEITLNPQEHTVNIDNLKRRDFELASGAKSIQPFPWQPKQDFHSEGDDRTGFATPETDQLIDRIQSTLDEEERKQMYLELQEILHDQLPIIPLIVPQGRIVIHKRYDTPVTPIFPGYSPSMLKLKDGLVQ
jgi:peptide/nickel transport system substrate-binding protein